MADVALVPQGLVLHGSHGIAADQAGKAGHVLGGDGVLLVRHDAGTGGTFIGQLTRSRSSGQLNMQASNGHLRQRTGNGSQRKRYVAFHLATAHLGIHHIVIH